MSPRSAIPWLVLFAVLAAIGAGVEVPGLPGGGDAGSAPEGGRVTEVVDGDTLALGRERVRLIGVDTPETRKPGAPVECFGPAASRFTERLVAGRRVRLSYDAERRDRYGRLLAYVRRAEDGRFVNAALVAAGYARPLVIAPNDRHAARFAALADRARRERRGLWSRC